MAAKRKAKRAVPPASRGADVAKLDETRVTHARDQADRGVERCAKLMTSGRWQTGPSHRAVAAEFGVSPRTVETWAAMASRMIRSALGDGEEIRGRLAALLERHERIAMRGAPVEEYYDGRGNLRRTRAHGPDIRAATAAVKAMAEVLGVVTQRHEHAVVVAQYEQLPREGKAKWLRDRARALLAEADRLEASSGDVHAAGRGV